jgi:hypothetical protein
MVSLIAAGALPRDDAARDAAADALRDALRPFHHQDAAEREAAEALLDERSAAVEPPAGGGA